MNTEFETNPLLNWRTLPAYDQIKAEHVEPAVNTLLAYAEEVVSRVEAQRPTTWAAFMPTLEEMEDQFYRTWGVVNHLHSVRNTPELREAYQKMQGMIVSFYNRYQQSRPLYETFCALRDSAEWDSYDEAQRRIITSSIKNAELGGVGLEGRKRERFNEISQRLAELSNQYSNNVLDATNAFQLKLTTAADIAGLPPSFLAMAAAAAKQAGHTEATAENGPWLVTLDYPSYVGFMKYSQCRNYRQHLYLAYTNRASAGEWDNTEIVDEILKLRQEEAELLGYESYAEFSLSRKMAPGVAAVEELLNRLLEAAWPAGERDMDELIEAARAAGAPDADSFRHWDILYWMERVREEKYALNDEELRPYFPLPQVLSGMFQLVERLFDVTVTEETGSVPVWHPDVQFFRMHNATTGKPVAAFYLDPYSRPAEKRGGAWMDVLLSRSTVMAEPGEEVRLPIAYMCCNQSVPVDDVPSLMTFHDVETLFHEFGHALHHMLTKVNYGPAAGVNNVEWDAVELPSQFMENWCYHPPTLKQLAGHYATGEPLPEEFIERILAARTFQSGYQTLRQVNFGLFDMTLHSNFDPAKETPYDVQQRIAAKTQLLTPLEEDNFYCSFSHIFAGGYAAGYYSYKWAEVLSADAFSAFEEAGLENEAKVQELGRRFRDTVLAAGGGQHPMQVFKKFRGREPKPEALLRHSGLISPATTPQ